MFAGFAEDERPTFRESPPDVRLPIERPKPLPYTPASQNNRPQASSVPHARHTTRLRLSQGVAPPHDAALMRACDGASSS